MGKWKVREKWQAFKKKYPAFEKSKNFKSDVGPQMDAFETDCEKCLKLVEQLETQLQAMRKTGLSLHNALKGYRGVIDQFKDDPKFSEMRHDFGGPPTWCSNANFAVTQALQQVNGAPYKINFQEGVL